jgi:hypothetical protein
MHLSRRRNVVRSAGFASKPAPTDHHQSRHPQYRSPQIQAIPIKVT